MKRKGLSFICKSTALLGYFLGLILISSPVYAQYRCETDCPPELSQLQDLVLRVITILLTLVGVVVLFLVIKSGVMVMIAQDSEKKSKGFKQLTYAILGLVGILLSYGFLVLIANWLGLVEGPFSFVKGGKLIFEFLLP